MSEASVETTVTETPASTATTEASAPNTPEARTEDGTIKDQSTTATPEPKADSKTADGAPETYTDFTLPEGRTISKETLGEATTLFKELGLSQANAQKLMDFAIKNQISAEGAGKAAYDAMRDGWRNEVLKDTTLSTGNDLKPEVSQGIGRLKASLGPELGGKFNEIMNISGLGDNPTMVKALYEISKFVTEGRPVQGSGPSTHGQTAPGAAKPSIANAMFPKLK